MRDNPSVIELRPAIEPKWRLCSISVTSKHMCLRLASYKCCECRYWRGFRVTNV